MLDYTCEGVPVAQLSTEEIRAALEDGVEITINDSGVSDAEAVQRILKRLQLELDIRKMGLR